LKSEFCNGLLKIKERLHGCIASWLLEYAMHQEEAMKPCNNEAMNAMKIKNLPRDGRLL